jgi:hypothetical protein
MKLCHFSSTVVQVEVLNIVLRKFLSGVFYSLKKSSKLSIPEGSQVDHNDNVIYPRSDPTISAPAPLARLRVQNAFDTLDYHN